MKVLLSTSSGRNFDRTQQELMVQALQGSVKKDLEKLIDKNSKTHGIDGYEVKVKDYPQQTSTVGEETVQLIVTLTLAKKRT